MNDLTEKLSSNSLIQQIGVGNGHRLPYSCLENPMDRGAWPAYSPWGHTESDMTEHANNIS